jgi:tryptophan-rich hypothetical protein
MNPDGPRRAALSPKKLLLSKWTAVVPLGKQKHFLVTAVIAPQTPGGAIEWVELEAVRSKRARRLRWRELTDTSVWRRGWR